MNTEKAKSVITVVPMLISGIARECISTNGDIKKVSDKYKLDNKERLELIQVISDMRQKIWKV